MGKLPAFLFYPKDWREDPALIMCSRAARSVWLDMLCLMFSAPIRGVCQSGDRPWTHEEIASAVGGDIGSNMACISELVSKGVAAVNDCGAIFSRRMVRDEQARKQNRERVQRFRARALTTTTDHEEITHVMPDVMPVVMASKRLGTGTAKSNVSSTKPTLEEVCKYCAERKNSVDPEKWFNYYSGNGWMVGRVHMKDWRAAIRYWERTEYGSNQQVSQGELLPTSAYRACGKNGCVDGWLVTENGGVKRCQCFEEYKRTRKAV